MCVEERWYLHWLILVSIVGPIFLPHLWFEYGLSSNQIRTNDIRNVVLLVVVSSSIHHYIFWVWPMLSPCSHNCGTPLIWKPGWIVVESMSNIFILSIILLNIKLVLETYICIIFVFRSWSICSDERSDLLLYMCIWCKLPSWIRESQCCSLWNHHKSIMHTCEEFCGLETCNLHSICIPSTPSHWLSCSEIRSLSKVNSLDFHAWRLRYHRWWFPTWTR